MGRNWFIGAIFVLSIATYIMAVYIQGILDFLKYPPPSDDDHKHSDAQSKPNIWRWVRNVWPVENESTEPRKKEENVENNHPLKNTDRLGRAELGIVGV